MKRLLISIATAAFSLHAQAASFDCHKAGTLVEKTICADPLLSKLDEVLAQNFRNMLTVDLGTTKQALRAEQNKWLAARNRCTDTKCLVSTYRTRIDETCEYGVVSGTHPECSTSDSIPEPSQSSQRGMPRSQWLNLVNPSLAASLCSNEGYFRSCFGLAAEQCERSVISAARVCSMQLANQLPERFTDEEQSRVAGAQLGQCAGNVMEQQLSTLKSQSQRCSDVTQWIRPR